MGESGQRLRGSMRLGSPEARSDDDDRDAGEQMRQYEGALRRYFARRVRGGEEVDDLVQEALVRLVETRERQGLDRPLAYLFRIAGNLLADRARKQSRTPLQVEIGNEGSGLAVAPAQEDQRHLADLRRALDAALDELSPRCRETFLLRRFHNLTTPQIAQLLGISSRMVQKHMTRAMTHVYLRLREPAIAEGGRDDG